MSETKAYEKYIKISGWVELYHKNGFHVRSDSDPPILIAPDKDDKIPDPEPPICAPQIAEIESDRYWEQPSTRYLYDRREARWNRFIRLLVVDYKAVPRPEDRDWLQKAGCMLPPASAPPPPPSSPLNLPLPPPQPPQNLAKDPATSPLQKRRSHDNVGGSDAKKQRMDSKNGPDSSPTSQLAQKSTMPVSTSVTMSKAKAKEAEDPGMHGGQSDWVDILNEDDIEDGDKHDDVDARLVRPQSQVRVPLKLESVAPPIAAAAGAAPDTNASLEETLFFANPARDTQFMRERIVVLACQVRHAQKLANAHAERGCVTGTSKYTRVEQAASRALTRAVDQFIETARYAYTDLDEVAISDRF